MASATVNPGIYSGMRSFELTPIELNGPRRYKRVALVFQLDLTGNDFHGETMMIHQYILKAFEDTLVAWPILGGSVRHSGARDGDITMEVRAPSTDTKPRPDFLETHTHNPEVQELVCQVARNSLTGDFFLPGRHLDLRTGMPPVLLKMAFFGNQLVLGFSFYEAVIDGEFISRFFSWMSHLSWHMGGGNGSILYRTSLKPVAPPPLLRTRFPFYDWLVKPAAQPTPRDRLVCQLVEFKYEVSDFIQLMRRTSHCHSYMSNANDKDYLVAILWVAIMQVRHSKGKVSVGDKARLNILLPGEPHARRRETSDWAYFGNSTVPTLAELSVQDLEVSADHPNSHFWDDAMCVYSIRGLAMATLAVHNAMNLVDATYVQELMGLKELMRPEIDWAAYEQGINRNTTGMTFEDWSGYFGDKTMGFPLIMGRPLRVLPCADDLEEGKIILLPQMGRHNARLQEVSWSAWLCLEAEIMEVVLRQLSFQGWINV